MKKNPIKNGELNVESGEFHPAAEIALSWIRAMPARELLMWKEAFASSGLAGNRLGEICAETLHRLFTKQGVSDRYLLGLAWALKSAQDKRKEGSQ